MSDAIYIFLVSFSNCSFPLLQNAPSSSSSRLLTISSRLITRYQLRSAIGRNISLGIESNEPSVFFTAFPVLPVQNFRTIVLNDSSICSQLNSLREVYAKKKEDKERRLAEEKHLAEAGLISPRTASPDATQDRDVAPDVAAPIDLTPAEAQEVDPTAAAPLPEAIIALPASDKAAGKRVRTDDSSSKKKSKKKKGSSTEAGKKLPIFEDRVASGNLLGGWAGPLLSPPDTLLESRKYAETASHFLRVSAYSTFSFFMSLELRSVIFFLCSLGCRLDEPNGAFGRFGHDE